MKQLYKRLVLFLSPLDGRLCILLFAVLLPFAMVILYSASHGSLITIEKQCGKWVLGMVLMLLLANLNPCWLQLSTPACYAGAFIILLLLFPFGLSIHGALRWIHFGSFRLQPSEMMKLTVPMMVSWIVSKYQTPPKLTTTFCCLVAVLIPFILVLKEPDLGTGLLILCSGLFPLFLAGLAWWWIIAAASFIGISLPIIWPHLHGYQKNRILTFLQPERDPLGSGYHILQAKIAIGHGGLWGKGWLAGTQVHLSFLPEQQTDFIFAVIAEEFGFIGCLGLIMIYLAILYRGFEMMRHINEPYQIILGYSLLFTLAIYMLVNIGMVIGLLPVVGVPLPFISYGGTSLVTLLASLGLIQGFHHHQPRRLSWAKK